MTTIAKITLWKTILQYTEGSLESLRGTTYSSEIKPHFFSTFWGVKIRVRLKFELRLKVETLYEKS